jgi:hypothetical protein
VKYYDGSIAKALVHLFPEIGVDIEKFPVPRMNFYSYFITSNIYSNLGEHWNTVQNRKDLFLKFATVHGFDPLVPEKWYEAPATGIHKYKVTKKKNKYSTN